MISRFRTWTGIVISVDAQDFSPPTKMLLPAIECEVDYYNGIWEIWSDSNRQSSWRDHCYSYILQNVFTEHFASKNSKCLRPKIQNSKWGSKCSQLVSFICPITHDMRQLQQQNYWKVIMSGNCFHTHPTVLTWIPWFWSISKIKNLPWGNALIAFKPC